MPTDGTFYNLYVKQAVLYVNGELTKGFAFIKPGDNIKIVADMNTAGKLFSKWTSTPTPYDYNGSVKYGDFVAAGVITQQQAKNTTIEFTAGNRDLHIYPATEDCQHKGGETSLSGSEVTPTCMVNGKYADVCCAICGLKTESAPRLAALGHNYVIDEKTVVKATCKNRGYTGDVICTNCGERYKNTKAGEIIEGAGVHTSLDLNAHIWNGGTVTKQQTYTENGIVTYACTVCNAKKVEATAKKSMTKPGDVTGCKVCSNADSVTITWNAVSQADGYRIYAYDTKKCQYTYIKSVNNNSASITDLADNKTYIYGIKAYRTYDGVVCESEKYAKVEAKTVYNHNFIQQAEAKYLKSAATCTAKAVYYKSCSVCGIKGKETFTSVKALGHTSVTDKAVAPTCTKTGKTAGAHCKVCGTVLTAQKTVKATGHKPVTVKAVAATLSKDGKTAGTKCSVCNAVITKQTTIAKIKSVAIEKTSYTYTGKAIKPTVTVKDSNGKTVAAKYYSVTYKNNTSVGKATVTVKFKGNYSGTRTLNFNIVPKGTTISKATSTKKATAGVSIKKQTTQTTGYEIQYSLNKNFKSVKTVKITKNTTTAAAISKLTSGKAYYFRIRTYKTVSKTNYYSSWSEAASVKIK